MLERVTFLIPRGEYAPSGVRRALDYLKYFAEDGIDARCLSFNSIRAMRYKEHIRRILKNAFLVDVLIAILDRVSRFVALLSLALITRPGDRVVVQWVLPPVWFVRMLQKRGVKVVFDFDDAVFLKNPSRVRALVSHVDGVIVGSHYNLEYASRINTRSHFLPTPVPLEQFEMRASDSDESHIRIGWMGGPFTVTYLSVLEGAFQALSKKYSGRLSFCIVGVMDQGHRVPSFDGIQVQIVPRIPPDDVPDYVRSFDIGVMPLFDRDFERGKCGLKALEYMASGVPAICSPVGENLYIIKDGENGLLAGSQSEWVDKISQLIESRDLRAKLSLAGRKTIEERYSTQVCYEQLVTILSSV